MLVNPPDQQQHVFEDLCLGDDRDLDLQTAFSQYRHFLQSQYPLIRLLHRTFLLLKGQRWPIFVHLQGVRRRFSHSIK